MSQVPATKVGLSGLGKVKAYIKEHTRELAPGDLHWLVSVSPNLTKDIISDQRVCNPRGQAPSHVRWSARIPQVLISHIFSICVGKVFDDHTVVGDTVEMALQKILLESKDQL